MRVSTENIIHLDSCWVGRGALEIIHGIPLQTVTG